MSNNLTDIKPLKSWNQVPGRVKTNMGKGSIGRGLIQPLSEESTKFSGKGSYVPDHSVLDPLKLTKPGTQTSGTETFYKGELKDLLLRELDSVGNVIRNPKKPEHPGEVIDLNPKKPDISFPNPKIPKD